MGFGDAIKSVFSKYATFSGRARRSEYWWFILFSWLVNAALTILSAPLAAVWGIAIFLPSIAVLARRLHDTGRSGWLYICVFVFGIVFAVFAGVFSYASLLYGNYEAGCTGMSFLGLAVLGTWVYMIVILCQDSQPGANKYGPNPKEVCTTYTQQGQQTVPHPISDQTATEAPSQTTQAVFCPQCGAAREPGSAFCKYCGGKF